MRHFAQLLQWPQQDSATEKEEKDTDEPAKPVTEEKVTEATSTKEEKEAEVVTPKEDKVEKTEKPAAEVDGKEKQSISHQDLLNAQSLDFTLGWLPKHN